MTVIKYVICFTISCTVYVGALFIASGIPKIIEHPSSVKLPGNKKAAEAMNCLATGEGNLNYRWEKYYSSTDSWKYACK